MVAAVTQHIAAVTQNNLGFLELLLQHEKQRPLTDACANEAAKEGHLDTLKFLHQRGFPWGTQTTGNAAINGHLDCLVYAHKNGCPLYLNSAVDNESVKTWECIVKNGSLDCLKYLRRNGFTWRLGDIELMVHHGHLDCLRYAYEDGYPWPETIGWIGYQYLECTRFIVDVTPARFRRHCCVLFDGCVGLVTHETMGTAHEMCGSCPRWTNKHDLLLTAALLKCLPLVPRVLRDLLCLFICEL